MADFSGGIPQPARPIGRRSIGEGHLRYLSSFCIAVFPDPASLNIPGRKFVAIFQANKWPGVLRVKRNGTDAETLTLRNPAGHQGLLVLESPAAPTSAAVFVLAFMLFAACAYWFGPIRSGRSTLPWLIFFLSVLHALFWAAQCIGTTNDSPAYVDTISTFYTEGQPDYFPPGYPALLGTRGEPFRRQPRIMGDTDPAWDGRHSRGVDLSYSAEDRPGGSGTVEELFFPARRLLASPSLKLSCQKPLHFLLWWARYISRSVALKRGGCDS